MEPRCEDVQLGAEVVQFEYQLQLHGCERAQVDVRPLEDIRCEEEVDREGRVGLRARSQVARCPLRLPGEVECLVHETCHRGGCGKAEEGGVVAG